MTTAQQQFTAHCATAQAMADEIAIICGNHFDINPDDIHWGHVGDAAHLVQKLSEILAAIKQ